LPVESSRRASIGRGCLRRHAQAAALLACVAGSAAGAGAQATPDAERAETRATMREIFESVRVLLPLSVRPDEFAAPANRATVEAALAALQRNAGALAEHARSDDPARRVLGDSLSADAGHALLRYRAGLYDGAAFLVRQTTENCVACHTKLRSPGDSPLAKHFVDRTALAKLPPAERARLEVATRQFDEAAESYEKLLASAQIHAGELVAPLVDYLTLQIRVRDDFGGARRTLDRFAERADLWRQLRGDVAAWSRALRELAPYRKLPASLASARDLIERARQLEQFPADRRGLVHYLVASSLLQRLIAEPGDGGRDTAEAYYLLGLCETHIGDDPWISEADLYLESAIRLAPDAPFAEDAYALLEEETLVGYTGSGGPHLPEPVAQHLEELRELIDR
jgi:tetratricopeptide (TPR) repeat protein